VPPSLRFGVRPDWIAFFWGRRAGRDEACVFARRFWPLAVLAAAARREPELTVRPVFRRAADLRRPRAPLRAVARAPDPARLLDGVFFLPFVEPFFEEPAAFRFAAFLAIVC